MVMRHPEQGQGLTWRYSSGCDYLGGFLSSLHVRKAYIMHFRDGYDYKEREIGFILHRFDRTQLNGYEAQVAVTW